MKNYITLDVFDDKGESLGEKRVYNVLDNIDSINKWIKLYDDKQNQSIVGYMENPGPDFQNNNFLCVINKKGTRHNNYFAISANSFVASIYFSPKLSPLSSNTSKVI